MEDKTFVDLVCSFFSPEAGLVHENECSTMSNLYPNVSQMEQIEAMYELKMIIAN